MDLLRLTAALVTGITLGLLVCWTVGRWHDDDEIHRTTDEIAFTLSDAMHLEAKKLYLELKNGKTK